MFYFHLFTQILFYITKFPVRHFLNAEKTPLPACADFRIFFLRSNKKEMVMPGKRCAMQKTALSSRFYHRNSDCFLCVLFRFPLPVDLILAVGHCLQGHSQ